MPQRFRLGELLGRRAVLALALLGSALGCRKESEQAAPQPSARSAFSRGQFVVVERSAAVFEQKRVLEVADGRMRVDAPIGAEPSWIASADAYAPGLKTPPAAGSYAICQRRDAWLPCQIDGVDGGRVQAHDASGRTLDVGLAQLIAPRAMTELNLKRHFQSAAGRKAFEAAVAVAGSPPRADGWLPMPRSGVIARREGRYYSAEIYEFDEEVPRVRFALDGRVTEIPVSELYPEPPYDLGQLRRGDFVLRRPPGPPEPWQPVQVRSLGNAELRVANLEGEVAAVPVRDVIPLGEKREGP